MGADTTHGTKLYKVAMQIGSLFVLAGIALLLISVLNAVTRLENLAPAEFRLLLEVMKNRFLR